jgi:hypothetical protein
MPLRALLLALLSLAAPGCGVILGYAGAQPVQVHTNPEGAAVYLDEVLQPQVSPCTLELDPTRSHYVRANLGELKGGRAVKKTLRVGIAVIDGFLTLGIGLVVDTLTGAIYRFEPEMALGLGAAPTSPSQVSAAAPCPTCSEPRGDAAVCPHCGMR